jgi:DNA polymerase I
MVHSLYNGVKFPCSGPDLVNVEKIDRGAVPCTLAMLERGMQVDLTHFAEMDKVLTQDMERITAEVHTLTGKWVNLGSGDQVAHLLHKHLGIKQPRKKFTPSGDRESVDHEALVAIQHEHECVPKILDYKEVEKLRGTYVRPIPRLAKRKTHGHWRLYTTLKMTRVPSGRYAAEDPNLLAFPTRTTRGRLIRKGFITDPGWVYVSIDFSQFEPRAATHYSQDPNLIRIYENEEDIYSDFAIAAFNLPDRRYDGRGGPEGKWVYPGVDKDEHRFPSKTCILAAIYDVSPGGLLEQMPVICKTCNKPASSDKPGIATHDCSHFAPLWTEAKSESILNSFYLRYRGLLEDRKRHHARARRYGYIWDLWGRLHHVAAVRSVHPWVVSAALRETGNFPYQGLNSGALKLTEAQWWDERAAFGMEEVVYPLLPIHDELLLEAREDVAEEVGMHVQAIMENCVPLIIPVKAEWHSGENWGEAKG